MHGSTSVFFLLIIVATLDLPFDVVDAGSFVYAGCSPTKFQPNTPFPATLSGVLSAIVATSATGASYGAFAAGNGTGDPPGAAVYALYQCRSDLSASDCTLCVQSAAGQINLVCPDADTASLQLEACLVRYSSADFLGRADASVVYRKCSPSAGGEDREFVKRREEVVAGLKAGGGFRVSSSGAVQGYAQCLGDLSGGDCEQCLAAAVGQLETACGAALAADVFLAQCYARYWASGYYVRYQTDHSDDDIGRTVAIIIGIVAGLAIFVVFISFLKRAC